MMTILVHSEALVKLCLFLKILVDTDTHVYHFGWLYYIDISEITINNEKNRLY